MQQGPFTPQGQGPFIPQQQPQQPQQQPPQRKPPISGGEVTSIFLKILLGALILFLFFVGLKIASVALQGIGGFAGDVFKHIERLFHDATHAFRSPRGFGAFIQLMLIAVFVGWAIKRIMNYISRR